MPINKVKNPRHTLKEILVHFILPIPSVKISIKEEIKLALRKAFPEQIPQLLMQKGIPDREENLLFLFKESIEFFSQFLSSDIIIQIGCTLELPAYILNSMITKQLFRPVIPCLPFF